jgi:hypothetical protein
MHCTVARYFTLQYLVERCYMFRLLVVPSAGNNPGAQEKEVKSKPFIKYNVKYYIKFNVNTL